MSVYVTMSLNCAMICHVFFHSWDPHLVVGIFSSARRCWRQRGAGHRNKRCVARAVNAPGEARFDCLSARSESVSVPRGTERRFRFRKGFGAPKKVLLF